MAAMLRDRTIIHAARVDVAAAQVRAGQLPLAALAMVSGWTYTQVLAHAGGGFIPAVTNSPQEFEAEISAAKTSIGRPVVIELSALAVATALPGRWPSLVAAFTELKLPRAVAADLQQGCQDLMRAPGTILSVGYDPSLDTLVSNQLSPAEWQYLARRASELTDAASDATITGNPRPAHFPGSPQPPWVTSVELAAQAEIPLWSDDVVIRALAASQGIPAFGTLALLHALIEDNTLPDTLRTDVQALAAARVVDLTLTPDELLHLAAANGWQPPTAGSRQRLAADSRRHRRHPARLLGKLPASPGHFPPANRQRIRPGTRRDPRMAGRRMPRPRRQRPRHRHTHPARRPRARHRSQPVRRHPNPHHANPDRPRRSPPIRLQALKFPGKPAPWQPCNSLRVVFREVGVNKYREQDQHQPRQGRAR